MTHPKHPPLNTLLTLLVLAAISCSSNPNADRDTQMRLADAYFQKRAYNKAVVAYQEAVKADPKLAGAHYGLAKAYLESGRPKLAFDAFIKTVELDPNNFDAQLKIGQFYLVSGRPDQAAARANIILAKAPSSASRVRALFLKSDALILGGKRNEAEQTLKQILAIDPKNSRANLTLARIASEHNAPSEELKYLTKAAESAPKDPATELELARFYEKQGHLDKAKLKLEEAVSQNQDDVNLVDQLARFHERHGDPAATERTYLKMAAMAPNDVAPKLALAAFYSSRGNQEAALGWMNQAYQMDPKNPQVQNALASIHLRMGNQQEVERYLDNILQRDPANQWARMTKGRLLYQQQKLQDSHQIFIKITDEYPNNGIAHYYCGLIELALGDTERAKTALLNALRNGPENIDARILLSKIYLYQRKPDAVLVQTKEILARTKTNQQAYLLQGNAHELNQQLQTARNAYLQAMALNQRDADTHYRLATVELQLGHADEALGHLHMALALNPNHIAALDAIVTSQLAQGPPAKMLAFLEIQIQQRGKTDRLTARLLAYKGYVLNRQEKYREGEMAFRQAIDIDPELISPYLGLATAFIKQDEAAKSLARCQNDLAKNPQQASLWTLLGTINDAIGRTTAASEAYEKALEIDSSFPPAAASLTRLFLRTGQNTDRALVLAKIANSRLGDDISTLDILGRALIANGQYEDAIPVLSRAIEQTTNKSGLLYQVALAQWKKGDKHDAQLTLGQALGFLGRGTQDFQERPEAQLLYNSIMTSRLPK